LIIARPPVTNSPGILDEAVDLFSRICETQMMCVEWHQKIVLAIFPGIRKRFADATKESCRIFTRGMSRIGEG
jgi:hypothetical protein